jgi:hypothetical protein
VPNQRGVVVFQDFDEGMVVKSFSLSCDLRIGNPVGGSGTPAYGLSINLARANDPIFNPANHGNVFNGSTAEPSPPGLPEEGTQTGIAVGFDTWDNGNLLPGNVPDVVGLMVRVEGQIVSQTALTTLNGACNDTTSLQTGPYNPALNGAPDELCWQPFSIVLDEDAKLTVTWKGKVILDRFQVFQLPGPMRLVVAGRTGQCTENHHLDNLQLTTVPPDTADHFLIGLPVGFRGLTVCDAGAAVADTNTILLKFDGVPVTPTEVIKSGAITTIGWWDLSAPLPVGSTHTVSLSIKDTQGNLAGWEGTFVVPSYVTLPPGYAVTDGDTSKLIFHNNGDGTMTLEWRWGGTIQAAMSVLGPWMDVLGACSPFTIIPTEKMLFFRLKR